MWFIGSRQCAHRVSSGCFIANVMRVSCVFVLWKCDISLLGVLGLNALFTIVSVLCCFKHKSHQPVLDFKHNHSIFSTKMTAHVSFASECSSHGADSSDTIQNNSNRDIKSLEKRPYACVCACAMPSFQWHTVYASQRCRADERRSQLVEWEPLFANEIALLEWQGSYCPFLSLLVLFHSTIESLLLCVLWWAGASQWCAWCQVKRMCPDHTMRCGPHWMAPYGSCTHTRATEWMHTNHLRCVSHDSVSPHLCWWKYSHASKNFRM